MNNEIPCFSCTAKCCKHYDVFVDHLDIINLSNQLRNFSFLKKLEYKKTFGYVPKFKLYDSDGKKKNWVVCLENPNRVCSFLKNDFCTIYSDRPIICKIYPFYYDRSKIIEMKNLCPVKWKLNESFKVNIENDYKQLLLNFLTFETICSDWNKIVKKESSFEDFLVYVKNYKL